MEFHKTSYYFILCHKLLFITFLCILPNKWLYYAASFTISLIAISRHLLYLIAPNLICKMLLVKSYDKSISALITQEETKMSYAWGQFHNRFPKQMMQFSEHSLCIINFIIEIIVVTLMHLQLHSCLANPWRQRL